MPPQNATLTSTQKVTSEAGLGDRILQEANPDLLVIVEGSTGPAAPSSASQAGPLGYGSRTCNEDRLDVNNEQTRTRIRR